MNRQTHTTPEPEPAKARYHLGPVYYADKAREARDAGDYTEAARLFQKAASACAGSRRRNRMTEAAWAMEREAKARTREQELEEALARRNAARVEIAVKGDSIVYLTKRHQADLSAALEALEGLDMEEEASALRLILARLGDYLEARHTADAAERTIDTIIKGA